jgi:hypothetical protein
VSLPQEICDFAPAVIELLGSPLEPHTESGLPADLYFASTPIATMNESDRRISFNLLTKFAISLSAAIGASGSPLRLRPVRLQEIYSITMRSDQVI